MSFVKKDEISIQSVFKTRPSYASYFIKIGKNKDALRYAICHSLSNIYFEETYLEIVDRYVNYMLDKLFNVCYQSFYRTKINENKNDIIAFFQDKLLRGYYITCYFDDYYIESSPHYNAQHYCSEHMVYGYDENECVFEVYMFDDLGLKTVYMPPDKYILSLYIFSDDLVPFTYSKLKYENDYSFNKSFIRQNICDYVESKNRFWFFDNSKKVFGLNALQNFYDYLNCLIDKHLPISINDCKLLLDHKKLFYKRLEYLEDLSMITHDYWAEMYYPVIKMARKQIDFCQEYNNSSDKSCCHIPYSNDLILKEENILDKLIKTGFLYDNG